MSARDRIHAMFALDETAETELDARLDAYRVEVLIKAGVEYEDCTVCGAAHGVGQPCNTCAFKAHIAAELGEEATAATATPDFFRPGVTYRAHQHADIRFECLALSTEPDSSERQAIGWRFGPPCNGHRHHKLAALDANDWACCDWTDTGPGEGQ